MNANIPQLSSRNQTVAVFIEHTESFPDFFFTVSILHFPGHHGEKFREINSSIAYAWFNYQKSAKPSASTSFIISCSSDSVGFCPSDLITVPNSLVVIVPSPSLSNKEKASLNSAICSSVSWSAYKTNCFASEHKNRSIITHEKQRKKTKTNHHRRLQLTNEPKTVNTDSKASSNKKI